MASFTFTSLAWGNFGLGLIDSGDTDSDVEESRKKLAQSLSLKNIVFMNQTHSADVVFVDQFSSTPTCDAIVTSDKGVGLAALAADCVPILIAGSTHIAAVHAGRAGMEKKVLSKTLDALRLQGEKHLQVQFGPSICTKCYEVDSSMYREIVERIPDSATTPDTHCLDIKRALIGELKRSEVEIVNFHNWDICTLENPFYFSHRGSQRESLSEGRQVGVVSL